MFIFSLKNIARKGLIQHGKVITCQAVTHGKLFLGKRDSEVIMTTMATQITSLTIVYSTVYSGPDQRKRQSSASLAFVRGIHR